MTSSVASSAQCTSSITAIVGRTALAAPRAARRRPCAACRSAQTEASRSPLDRRRDVDQRAQRPWRPRARRRCPRAPAPRSACDAQNRRTSALLPIPASPETSTSRPPPDATTGEALVEGLGELRALEQRRPLRTALRCARPCPSRASCDVRRAKSSARRSRRERRFPEWSTGRGHSPDTRGGGFRSPGGGARQARRAPRPVS